MVNKPLDSICLSTTRFFVHFFIWYKSRSFFNGSFTIWRELSSARTIDMAPNVIKEDDVAWMNTAPPVTTSSAQLENGFCFEDGQSTAQRIRRHGRWRLVRDWGTRTAQNWDHSAFGCARPDGLVKKIDPGYIYWIWEPFLKAAGSDWMVENWIILPG